MELTTHKRKEDIEMKWFEIDASGQTLGRLATKVATILRGKNKSYFSPHVDCGDYVVITNIDKITMTGKKWTDKKYYSYSGYQSGLKVLTAEKMAEKHPEHIIMHAVKGMLPKNKLANQVIKKLKVYTGSEHPHTGQNPEKIEL